MGTVHAASATTRRRTDASARKRRVAECLGVYADSRNRSREVIAAPGAHGSTLVIDRIAGVPRDQRLVAHLSADEPAQNAHIVCSLYLGDEQGRRSRPVTPADFDETPLPAERWTSKPQANVPIPAEDLLDRDGRMYRLEPASRDSGVPALRWHRRCAREDWNGPEAISVRDVIGGLESYEPVRTLTAEAIAGHRDDPTISVTVLRGELDRVCSSPVVLNRGLREAVLAAIADGRLSLSEIAIRCGRVKRNAKGKQSGETSWLTRRIGLSPESGKSDPTPWIHTDVLALIARSGLGVAPREVELGWTSTLTF
jgi:hypothetical protein